MHRTARSSDRRAQRGQIIVVAALAMVAIIGGVSLVLEGGNAYAHQRIAQNAADSVANAGRDRPRPATRRRHPDRRRRHRRDATRWRPPIISTRYNGVLHEVDRRHADPGRRGHDEPALASRSAAADAGERRSRPARRASGRWQPDVRDDVRSRARHQPVHGVRRRDGRVSGALTGGIFMPVVFPVSMAQLRRLREHRGRRRAVADEQPGPDRPDRPPDRPGVHRAPVQDRWRQRS